VTIEGSSPLRHPGVLADLEPDAYARKVEEHVAERVALAVPLELDDLVVWPWLEPARLVVKALAREVFLRSEACDLAVGHDAGGIVKTASAPDRQPDAHDHPAGLREERHQHAPGALGDIGAEERILAAVPGRTELREGEQGNPRGLGFSDHGLDASLIARPVERRLIERRGGDLDRKHVYPLALCGPVPRLER